MAILDYLKEGMFDDENNPSTVEQGIQDQIQFHEEEIADEAGEIAEGDTLLDKNFIIRLVDYVDTKIELPAFGSFDNQILNEVRKSMDESDNKKVISVKKRIHKLVIDEKKKFLERLQRRMEKVKVPKKKY